MYFRNAEKGGNKRKKGKVNNKNFSTQNMTQYA